MTDPAYNLPPGVQPSDIPGNALVTEAQKAMAHATRVLEYIQRKHPAVLQEALDNTPEE